jgi:putative nucleotidyltransferase with HDIG domain
MAELLFVGRSEGDLKQLGLALGRAEPDWSIRHVHEIDAALEQLGRRPAALVLAELEEADGDYERLFTSIADSCPGTIRFALVKPLDTVPPKIPLAHQCLAVREDISYLQPILAAGIAVAQRASEHAGLVKLISRLHDVPSPPALYFDIREQLEAPDGNLAQMADITARDPSLVARVLKIANSGFYALPRTVSDITEAIGLIGTDSLLGLVLAAHLYSGLPPPGLNLELLWQHTTKVSSLARQIAQLEGGNRMDQSTSAVAGLLHDIGLMMLLENEPARYQPLWQRSGGDEAALARMEREAFGVTHGELGALVLSLWTLPEAVVQAVANSHKPDEPGLSLTCRAVLAAEWLLDSSGTLNLNVSDTPAALGDMVPETLDQWVAARDDLAMQTAAG